MQDEWAVPVSAFLSSIVSTTVGYPVDSVKTRLQTYHYEGAVDCFRKTWHNEGARAFYRGLSVPLSSATVMRTASFTIYQDTARVLSKGFQKDPDSVAVTFVSGMVSGLSVSVLACPFELTKLATQLDQLITPGQKRARTPVEAGRSIYSKHGLPGLWAGLKWHALRDGFGTAFFFSIYYRTKSFLHKTFESEASWHHAVSGVICGCSAWTIVYPLDTLKAVKQKNMLSGTSKFKVNTSALYRGVSISLFRSGLINGINFVLLEKLLTFFRLPIFEPAKV